MIKSKFIQILFLLLLFLNQINSDVISISLNDIGTDISDNENYSIASNVLTLKAAGDYKITDSCTECQIAVNKEIEVTITLDSIQIDNSATGPFVIKKNSKVNLILSGESSIIDNEDINNEENEEYDFEGAGIRVKSSSELIISGEGTLNVKGNPKNGIKGKESSKITIESGTINIDAAKNALACDNLLTINGGTINIKSESDGIKAEPDSDDDASLGQIIINDGTINIVSQSDGIQAGYKLEINGGIFYITTYEGASSSNFDKDTMSAKGIKCSTNEHENVENEIIINGGEFHLNTSDDAVHSDYNLTITKGNFEIITGDDGIHTDQYLVLGQKDEEDNSLLNIKIMQSYEGLEGAQVYIYSGTYHIIASDDGINSAGDTNTTCEGGQGGPGGQGEQGGEGGQGENPPSPPSNLRARNLQMNNNQCYIFHIYIYGGDIYVNTGSDGLDANGNIYIEGGNLEVWGQSPNGDGDPIDLDGTLYINGGTVLAGGRQGMTSLSRYSQTIQQNFIVNTNTFSANKEISIKNVDNVVKTITIPKKISYLFYCSNEVTSSFTFSEGSTSYTEGGSTSNQNNNGNNGPNDQNRPNGPQRPEDTTSPSSSDGVNNYSKYSVNELIILIFIFMLCLFFL